MAAEGMERTGRDIHNITLDDRKHLFMTGVRDVDNYDEHIITIRTTRGILTVEGEGLHVKHLTLENGELTIEGTIGALYYTDESKAQTQGGGFFSRLFR